ncbi:MAG: RNA polymerase sigma-70 factor [Tannerellaceae bacterium]|jgi:RNA polymerase sigma-70 factor (ECF subfamily)|nr:RNA polymerase sigma-70 factor [Tannerellaceae bacterium]
MEITDKQTLYSLRKGNVTAFEAVYKRYGAWVYNFFNLLLPDKSMAEDLTQTVFLKIWERHADIRPDYNFEAYLFTIARNLISKEIERRLLDSRLREAVLHSNRDIDLTTEQNIEAASLRRFVDRLVEQLPTERRRVYRMSREQHLSNKEISRQLSISEKTVETQLYRSLRFLKRQLSGN